MLFEALRERLESDPVLRSAFAGHIAEEPVPVAQSGGASGR